MKIKREREREREQNERPTFSLQILTRIIFAAQQGDLVCARASKGDYLSSDDLPSSGLCVGILNYKSGGSEPEAFFKANM